MNVSFDNFQIQKLISQIVRAQKVDEKMGSLVYWGHFHVSYLMVVKVPKVVHFFQFCTAVSKKFKSVLAVCIYVFESSPCVFAEN